MNVKTVFYFIISQLSYYLDFLILFYFTILDPRMVPVAHFVAFSEKHSAILRVADYYACVEFHVIVYDVAGRPLLDNNYKGEGTVRGVATISPASNYAAPAEVALSNVIVMLVDDINQLDVPTNGQ